jgi:hypothetical protein
MGHRAVRVAHVQQADLALVDGGKRVRDERVEAGLVDLDVEDAGPAPPAGTVTVWTLCRASSGFMSPNG